MIKTGVMNKYRLKIRNAVKDDLSTVIKVHALAFPGFFLTYMGYGFLKEMYSGYLTHPSGIFLVAVYDGELVGFVTGTTSPGLFFTELRRKRAFFFLLYALPGLLRRPFLVVKKLFSAMFYHGDKPAEIKNSALISSIGVAPNMQGKSVGKKLLERFEEQVFSNGVESIYLITDESNNDYVRKFYSRNHYDIESRFTQNTGRTMLRYIKRR